MGYSVDSRSLRYPTYDLVESSEYCDELFSVYSRLGGINKEFPLNLRRWDLEVDGVAVELDEALHFNRYRRLTLQSPIYNKLRRFPLSEYKGYCAEYEGECLRAGHYGRKWSNNSCEAQFGPPSLPGVLDGNGPPRWKQRAFYDFVKDLTPLVTDVPFVRISIWDKISVNGRNVLVRDALAASDTKAGEPISELLKRRIPK